ncbi:MAG: hypothetical protein L0Z71_16155 [Anaerolineae bacterium]|nr:hypothetical protein [Anaerolineae bacterium]
MDRLDRRSEFTHAFKSALERGIARKLAVWQPGVQAVFRFDKTWTENMKNWDSSIHLLVLVSKLSNRLKGWSGMLDQNLMSYLNQLGWSRFHMRQSILEIQQVTPDEVRRGISYGAMFYAVYSVPVQVWPRKQRRMSL